LLIVSMVAALGGALIALLTAQWLLLVFALLGIIGLIYALTLMAPARRRRDGRSPCRSGPSRGQRG
jgi:uncharacterized membrane protein